MSHISVITTVGTLADARLLARSMVERQLAACAHIAPIESFYRWQGAVHNDTEFKITFKARAEHYARIEAAIRAEHPYQLPDIHALALEQVYAPYASWLEESTEQQSAPGDAQSQRD